MSHSNVTAAIDMEASPFTSLSSTAIMSLLILYP